MRPFCLKILPTLRPHQPIRAVGHCAVVGLRHETGILRHHAADVMRRGWLPLALALVQFFLAQFNVEAACFRSEEHTSELQSRENLVCRLLLEKKKVVSTRSTLSV